MECNEVNKIYVDMAGKKLNIFDEIEMLCDDILSEKDCPKNVKQNKDVIFSCENSYKDSLIANLYATVEFMKKEMEEKHFIIRSLMDLLNKERHIQQTMETRLPNDSFASIASSKSASSFESLTSVIEQPNGNESIENHSVDNLNQSLDDTRDINSFNDGNNGDGINEVVNDDDNNGDHIIEVDNESIDTNDKLINQLDNIRRIKQQEFVQLKSNNDVENKWPQNTILIASDSMMNQIDGDRLSKKFNVKVKAIGGCTIEQMYAELTPLLRMEPDYVILHVGTNDSVKKSSDYICDELIKLKHYIENFLPNVMVILSKPIIRVDNSKANLTIRYVNKRLDDLNILMIDNSNIREDNLGKKGLHLNRQGTTRLAMNIISMMRQL